MVTSVKHKSNNKKTTISNEIATIKDSSFSLDFYSYCFFCKMFTANSKISKKVKKKHETADKFFTPVIKNETIGM